MQFVVYHSYLGVCKQVSMCNKYVFHILTNSTVTFWKTGYKTGTNFHICQSTNRIRQIALCKSAFISWDALHSGLYPSTFADPRFRNEDSVFVMHECSSGGQEGKLSLKWLIQRAIRPEFHTTLLRNLTGKLL